MKITEYLKNHLLYLDGGTGTLLQEAGLRPGEPSENWNLTHPDKVTAIHKAYFDAGSNLVNANTFGVNALKYRDDATLEALISAGIENVKKARDLCTGTQEKWVSYDVGPLGRLLRPFGDLDFEDAVAIFAKGMKIAAKCGADVVFIETMNDSYETKAALLAAKEACELPVFVSNAYGEDGKMMTGASPAAMVAMLEGLGADAIGLNCSFGPEALSGVAEEYLAASSIPVLFKPNAGLPRVENGRTVFDCLPDEFSKEVRALAEKGVRAVGGCCGTTPDYIRAVVEATKDVVPYPITEKSTTVVSSYTHAVAFGDRPVRIGERINPTGKKKFKEALKVGDIGYILREGIAQKEKGADILDVNVGLPEIDEISMLKSAVTELQAVLDTPLQIDTADPCAMETALRLYNGKPMINSVNGKKESMDAVFPLAKKYGGVIVALTLDENGIPETAKGRLTIAKKILREAEKFGIKKKDIVFDPLALTVSADDRAGIETLKAVKSIRTELGCHTSLGVSNVSFGLPARDAVNSTFFAMALSAGLSAAILNPYSADMTKVYAAYLAINGQDTGCAEYIRTMEALAEEIPSAPAAPAAANKPKTAQEAGSELENAVIRGLKNVAAEKTRELLLSKDPLSVVNGEIIPALDKVGKGFEEKTVYLPSLLMCAEAAGAAFEVIKSVMTKRDASAKCPFVLATVKGDIHDIGKNIVRLLLENYGFAVHDLGRDVEPERIVDEVLRTASPLCGLSALMTTTVGAMEETIRLLRKKAPTCKIVVGGAVLNKDYAEAIGADKYAKDAMETVRYAEEIYAELKK